jgi:hypothetical protein
LAEGEPSKVSELRDEKRPSRGVERCEIDVLGPDDVETDELDGDDDTGDEYRKTMTPAARRR